LALNALKTNECIIFVAIAMEEAQEQSEEFWYKIRIGLTDPYVFIKGFEALALGLILLLGTGCFGYLSGVVFNGVLDIHFQKAVPFKLHMAEQLLDWSITVLVFYSLGHILSNSQIKILDIGGAMAIARFPMFIASFFALFVHPHLPLINQIGPILFYAAISLATLLWTIKLMYNAFTIYCNVEGMRAVGGFIVALILSEILSLVVFFQIYQHLLAD
jgi:hypothetical protein